MASKKKIYKKLHILFSQTFENAQEAFEFFDKNGDKKLSKKELKTLLKAAQISGFISNIAANKMIKGLDKNKDKKLDWHEFKDAVDSMLDELNKKESSK